MDKRSVRWFSGYLRTRWASPRRIRFWLLVLIILYTVLGFFGLPWIIQYLAVATAQEDFGRELRIEAIQANPYSLTLRIDGVELDDTDNRQLLGWNRLFIDLAWSSVVDGAWTFETIRFDKPFFQEERFASGETRLSRLAAEQSYKGSSDDDPAPLPALRINNLRVEDGVLRFADNLQGAAAVAADNPKQVSLELQDVGLSVKQFALQKGTRSPLRLEGQLSGGGKLAFDGTLQVLPTPGLEGSARIDELSLVQAAPYLRQFADVRLVGGTLNLSGQMQTDAQQPFAFQGSAGVKALSIRAGPDDEPLIGWQSLHTEKLDLRLEDRQLETDPIVVNGLSGRVVIYEDQTTNFGQIMGQRASADPEDDNDAGRTDEEAAPFGIVIEAIDLTDGDIRFADYSLPLPFSTSIHTLGGHISTLSSTSAEPARIKLEGQVAEYGLARVDGTVDAWHPTHGTSLQLRFRNLEIPEYSPYTVDFAGRKIAGGTMDLDLDYTVKDGRLDGQNNLVLHDLKLGEKMASSDAMDLPLDLAIALLKDNEGVIDLDLTVTGSVADPEFDFGEVIRQAVGNAIASIIEAPFSFLASLVGADSEDLGQVEFLEGRSDLLPPQRERVAKLREALNQRPALVVELAGPFSRSGDGPALQRQKATQTLRRRLAEAGREAADPSLTAEPNQGVLEQMFTTYYPQADLQAIQARFTETQDESSDGTGLDALAYRNHLAERVIAEQSITDAELEAIANARASSVRDTLVDPTAKTSIAADRVRLLDPKEVDSVDGERIAMEVGVTAD